MLGGNVLGFVCPHRSPVGTWRDMNKHSNLHLFEHVQIHTDTHPSLSPLPDIYISLSLQLSYYTQTNLLIINDWLWTITAELYYNCKINLPWIVAIAGVSSCHGDSIQMMCVINILQNCMLQKRKEKRESAKRNEVIYIPYKIWIFPIVLE